MPTVRIPAALLRWESPVSVDILDSAGACRVALEQMDASFVRKKSTRLYSKFNIVMMVPRGAYVFQFTLQGDTKMIIETWQTQQSTSAEITWLRIEDFRAPEEEFVRKFLRLYREAAGKDPWAFTFRERSRAGAILPEFRRARKAWESFGFETGGAFGKRGRKRGRAGKGK